MILLLESLHPEAEALLASAGPVLRAVDPNEPPAELAPVRAILTRGRGRIPEALLARCPALAVIARAGAGLDNLDTAAAARRGIAVIHAPGANTRTVAEHTLALMLDLARGITRSARAVAAGRWEERAGYRGDELDGLTLGIVGFGNIGRLTALKAGALGMKVLAHDPQVGENDAAWAAAGARRSEFAALLEQSDVVSLHIPLTAETRGLLDEDRLARMKRDAVVINTARGGIVDEAALARMLREGRLGGAALDVFDDEPLPAGSPLVGAPRLLLTPHIAGVTLESNERVSALIADRVADALDRC